MRPALLVVFTAIGTIFSPEAHGFQDEAPFKIRTDTRVVEIDVSVRDSQGRPVADLNASDFAVTDDGKARAFTIFSFNRETPDHPLPASQPDNTQSLPASAVLPPNVFTNARAASRAPAGHSTIILVDAINGWFDNFGIARQSVLGLLDKVPADEKIAIYALMKGVGMVTVQNYTTDHAPLAEAMKALIPRGMPAAPPRRDGSSGMIEMPSADKQGVSFSSVIDTDQAGFSSIGEKEFAVRLSAEDVRAALNALSERLKSLPGRKSLFWITQGFPPAQIGDVNQEGWDKTFAALNDANVAVNTVDSNGLNGPIRFWGPGAINTLKEVAERTGGQAYYYRNDLDRAMASEIADSRSTYVLGFYLNKVDARYHQLKVKVDRPGLQLSYRQGYYARNETVLSSAAKKSALESALLNPSGLSDVEITASIDISPGKPRSNVVASLTLGPGGLSLKKTEAGYSGYVEEMFLEADTNGHMLGRFSTTKQFSFKTSYKPQFDGRGVTLPQTIPLVPGAMKLTIVVRDTASGRVGSLVIPLSQTGR